MLLQEGKRKVFQQTIGLGNQTPPYTVLWFRAQRTWKLDLIEADALFAIVHGEDSLSSTLGPHAGLTNLMIQPIIDLRIARQSVDAETLTGRFPRRTCRYGLDIRE